MILEDLDHLAETLELAIEVCHRAGPALAGERKWSRVQWQAAWAELHGLIGQASAEVADLRLLADEGQEVSDGVS